MFLYESLKTLILAVALVGSQPISQQGFGEKPQTFGDLLKRPNIELTQQGLVDALRNTDPEVRSLAAHKLAEDKAVETIPAIKDALASEKVPWTRDAHISAQPVYELQNRTRLCFDDAFHHQIADGVHHRNRNAFLVYVETDIFSASHKGVPFL